MSIVVYVFYLKGELRMSVLEVSYVRTFNNETKTSTQQLQNVTHFECSTITSSFNKLKEQEEAYGDGRVTIIRADDNASISPYEAITWTCVKAWCKDARYNKIFNCYLFIEHHFSMTHTVSFIVA